MLDLHLANDAVTGLTFTPAAPELYNNKKERKKRCLFSTKTTCLQKADTWFLY